VVCDKLQQLANELAEDFVRKCCEADGIEYNPDDYKVEPIDPEFLKMYLAI
jgi:hypothetical protein